MKKVISFSLWGDSPFYNVGAIRNAELALEFYPDWVCYYYVGNDVPADTITQLKSFDHVKVIEMNKSSENFKGTLWRFYTVSEQDVDIMISRDVDCRLSQREADAVNEWLDSGEVLHIMRDHPMHTWPIAAGMWGCRCKETMDIIKEEIPNFSTIYSESVHIFKDLFDNWYAYEMFLIDSGKGRIDKEELMGRTVDQVFLRHVIYQIFFKNRAFVHDSFPMHNCWSGRQEGNRSHDGRSFHKENINTGFCKPRKNWDDFVGQIFFEDESANQESSEYLKEEYKRIIPADRTIQ